MSSTCFGKRTVAYSQLSHSYEPVPAPNPHACQLQCPPLNSNHSVYIRFRFLESSRGREEWKPSEGDYHVEKGAPPSNVGMNPNLMLNSGFWIPSKLYLRALAAFGVLLQLFMFGYASWATYIEMLLLDDQPPGRWALPVAIAGTCLLGFGMFMCAHVIDRSSWNALSTEKRQSISHKLFLRVTWQQSMLSTWPPRMLLSPLHRPSRISGNHWSHVYGFCVGYDLVAR